MKGKTISAILLLAALTGVGCWLASAGLPDLRALAIPWSARAQRLFPVLIEGKVGYIDESGKLMVTARFDPLLDPSFDAITCPTPPLSHQHRHWRIRWAADSAEGACMVKLGDDVGYVDASGGLISAERFDEGADFRDGTAWVWRDEKLGLIDLEGRTLVAPHYEECFGSLDSEIIAANSHGQWRHLDRLGRQVGGQVYEDAGSFSEGLAPVKIDGNWGYVDTLGRLAIPPQYDSVSSFQKGLAAVKVDGNWGFVDRSGRVLIEPQFWMARRGSSGLSLVITISDDKRKRWGVVDARGRLVAAPTFDYATFGRAGSVVLRNRKGKGTGWSPRRTVIEPEPDGVDRVLSEGLRKVRKDDLYGYADEAGEIVIDYQFPACGPFRFGLAPAMAPTGAWGFIDRRGTFVISAQFMQAKPFKAAGLIEPGGPAESTVARPGMLAPLAELGGQLGTPLAVVEVGGRWGIIDSQGRFRTKPTLDPLIVEEWGLEFSEGRARVARGGKVGFVDSEGLLVIRPRFDAAEPFSGGLARVMVDAPAFGDSSRAKWGYIDRQGRWVWRPTR